MPDSCARQTDGLLEPYWHILELLHRPFSEEYWVNNTVAANVPRMCVCVYACVQHLWTAWFRFFFFFLTIQLVPIPDQLHLHSHRCHVRWHPRAASMFFALGALCATSAAKLFRHLFWAAAKCRCLSAQSSHITVGTKNMNVVKVCVHVDMQGSSVSHEPNVKNRMWKYK